MSMALLIFDVAVPNEMKGFIFYAQVSEGFPVSCHVSCYE